MRRRRDNTLSSFAYPQLLPDLFVFRHKSLPNGHFSYAAGTDLPWQFLLVREGMADSLPALPTKHSSHDPGPDMPAAKRLVAARAHHFRMLCTLPAPKDFRLGKSLKPFARVILMPHVLLLLA